MKRGMGERGMGEGRGKGGSWGIVPWLFGDRRPCKNCDAINKTRAKVIWHWAVSLRTCYLGEGKSYGVGDGTVR